MANQHTNSQSSINRRIAIDNGEGTYEGSVCKHCGTTTKYVSNYGCKHCSVERGMKKLNDPELMAQYRTNEKKSVYRKNNPDKIKVIQKKYRDKPSVKERQKKYYQEHKKERKDVYLQKTYGISLQEYDEMLEKQDYKCAICGDKECPTGRDFAVDHDHETGEVRALLCARCNRGLGMFEYRQAFSGLISYLEEYNLC